MEWGSIPRGTLKEVDRNYDVKAGQIYAYKGVFTRIPFKSEESYLNETISAIMEKGDQPLYVKVEFTGPLQSQVEIFFIAKHRSSSTPIWFIIVGIIAILGLIAYIVHESHMILEAIPEEAKGAMIGIGGIILLILIIYLLARGRER